MKCSEHCTYSQVPAEGYSPTLFSDMSQFARSNGINTVAKFSGRESPEDGSQGCTCTKEMSECSTHPNGKEEWIASMRASLALRLASLENERARWTKEICGLQPYESLGKFGPDWSFSKTSLDLFPADTGGQSYPTFPASGMIVAGRCWELTRLVPRTEGNDGGAWPTPDAGMGRGTQAEWAPKRPSGTPATYSLNQAVRDRMWPTPRAFMHKDSSTDRAKSNLGEVVGGKLNPRWVAWLMGWPTAWTDSKHWATVKSRSKRRPRSGFYQGD